MKFDIARQPLVPAFLTLGALAVAALWRVDASALPVAATQTAEGSVIPPLGALLTHFQNTRPVWAHLLGGYFILFAGMCTGRVASRYNLYAVGTCLTIPLYAVAACGIRAGEEYLAAFAASALMALTIKNFCRSFRNGYAFDALFRAGLYLGLLVLVCPSAAPLLLLLPFAVLLFRRTVRESVVAAAGLVLPLAILSYANWGAGGTLLAPFETFVQALTAGSWLQLLRTTPLPGLVLLGGIVLLNLAALLSFLGDRYAAGMKPRFLLLFIIGVLVLTLAALAGPPATGALYPLLAVPSALLLPVLFVRIHRFVALPLYLLLLAGALLNIFLQ